MAMVTRQTRGRQGRSAAKVPYRRALPAGRGKDHDRPGRSLPVWCLTNTCIAADLADPKSIKEMETGQKLQLEVVDSNVLAVTTALPINQFAAVRQGTPTQTFEQNIDE